MVPNARAGSRITRILAVPLSVAWLLGLFAAGVTLGHEADGTWHVGCYGSEICVYQNSGYGGAEAAMAGGADHGNDYAYTGQYPGGSSVNLNDSVSSLQNTYNARDVYFYYGIEYSGTNVCYDSYTGWSWVNFFNNDQYSSHNVVSSDFFC